MMVVKTQVVDHQEQRQGDGNGTALSALAHGLAGVLRYHRLMGIETYPFSPALKEVLQAKAAPPIVRSAVARGEHASAQVKAAPVPAAPRVHEKGESEAQLNALAETIKACRRCSVADRCLGVVLGRGQVGASLLVVGDYSLQEGEFSASTLFGPEEDTMLWNMMRAIGLTPNDVYATNVLKCCLRSSVRPSAEEVHACREHLLREIDVVQPKVLCAMGELAAHALVDSRTSSFHLRGRFHPYRENRSFQVMVTLHPRLLLKNADMKKAAWQDLQVIQRFLQTS